jgi:hypothetical protein
MEEFYNEKENIVSSVDIGGNLAGDCFLRRTTTSSPSACSDPGPSAGTATSPGPSTRATGSVYSDTTGTTGSGRRNTAASTGSAQTSTHSDAGTSAITGERRGLIY